MTSAFMSTYLNFRMQEIEVKLADIFHACFLPGAAMMILTSPNVQLHLHFQKYPGVEYLKIREIFQQTLLTRVVDHIYFAPLRQCIRSSKIDPLGSLRIDPVYLPGEIARDVDAGVP